MDFRAMIHAYLIRNYSPTHTQGLLIAKDDHHNILFSCVVLELPWLSNQPQVSCIPEGEYLVKERRTAKFGRHYHIQDVPDRTWILQHPGNHTSDIRGCQLPGAMFRRLNSDQVPDVIATRFTLDRMLPLFGKEYRLHIMSSTGYPTPQIPT